jgi:hypothetical protein
MTNYPRPAFLMPLRLEIWHDDTKAKIRWYPDDCHVVADKEDEEKGKFNNPLERFLGQGYELKTLPSQIHLYTMKNEIIKFLAAGRRICDDKAFADIQNLRNKYSENIEYTVKEYLLLGCKKLYSDTRDDILGSASASRITLQNLFEKYEEEVVKKVMLDRLNGSIYQSIKTSVQQLKITELEFVDGTRSIRLRKLISKSLMERVRKSNLLPDEAKLELEKLISNFETFSYSMSVYGVLRPRVGDPNLPAARWTTDFGVAEAIGMAITIDGKEDRQLGEQLAEAEWLIAAGLRDENDSLLEDIFRSQIAAGHFKILHQGEPTNNTREEKVTSIKSMESKSIQEIQLRVNAELLSQYLGVGKEIFAGVENADLVETDIIRILHHLYWPICSVNYFEQTYANIDKNKDTSQITFNNMQEIFVKNVNARGHLPAVRIGENPYGFVLTGSRSECNASPFFETFRMVPGSLRQKLLELARSHGRLMVTDDGVDIEKLYKDYSDSNMGNKKNTASFHDYVLSQKKNVYSKAESDFERLENILRQNAVSNRLDLEETETTTEENIFSTHFKEHRRSSDTLFVETGETKEDVIQFLEKLKQQLEANAFALNLLLIDEKDIDNLIQYLNNAIELLSQFIGRLGTGRIYGEQNWGIHAAGMAKIKELVIELKKVRLPANRSKMVEIIQGILDAFDTLPKIEKLASQEKEMLNVLESLARLYRELEKTGSTLVNESGNINAGLEENRKAAIAFITSNQQDIDNKLDRACENFVSAELEKRNREIDKSCEPFGMAKEAAHNVITNIQIVNNELLASKILSSLTPISNALQKIKRDLKTDTTNSNAINAQISSLQTNLLSLAQEKMEMLSDTVMAISASRSNLEQYMGSLGNQETNRINLKKWFANYLESVKKIKGVLELSLAWKEPMPILRRMLVLSIVYACRGGYVGENYPEDMKVDLDTLIKWLESDGVTVQDLQTMLMQVLDCFSSRMDVWMTANASKRLDELEYKDGCNLGVYGFLERPFAKTNRHVSEFFQAPSLDQAKTVAILRAGSLTDEKAFQINLTAERIDKVVWFIQGLQKGYSSAELLGRYAERLIHDEPIDVVLLPLRKKFPLYVREDDSSPGFMNIINGEKFEVCTDQDINEALQGINGISQNEIDKTKNIIRRQTKSLRDAVADLSIAEAVYQQITGNTAGVQAWLEASEGKAIPPIPQVVMTPRTGYSKVQRILFSIKAIKFFDDEQKHTPREISEPSLANYVKSIMDGFANIRVTIKVFRKGDSEELDVKEIECSKIEISPIDLVIGGKNLFTAAARIKYWEEILASASEGRPGKLRDEINKGSGEFFNTYDLCFEFKNEVDKKIIEQAAQIQGFLKMVTPIEPLDLNVGLQEPDFNPQDAQQHEIQDRISILDKNMAIGKCLKDRAAQLSHKVACLLENDPVDDIKVQQYLLQALLWGIPDADFPISRNTSEGKKLWNDINNNLQKIKKDLESIKTEGEKLLDESNNQLEEIKRDMESGIQMDLDGTQEKLNVIQFQLNSLILKATNQLKSLGGKTDMMILPPFEITMSKLGNANLEDTQLNVEFKNIEYVRRNMHAFSALMSGREFFTRAYKYRFKSLQDVVNEALHNSNLPIDQAVDITNIEITPHIESWNTSSTDLYFISTSEEELKSITGSKGVIITGFKVDEWTDFIPKGQETTAITFNHDVPQSEAPNCFLLCAPALGSQNWEMKNLVDSIANVIDLMKIRTLTTDDLLADPEMQKHLPTLRYSREYADDFPPDVMTFLGAVDLLSKGVPSISVSYKQVS